MQFGRLKEAEMGEFGEAGQEKELGVGGRGTESRREGRRRRTAGGGRLAGGSGGFLRGNTTTRKIVQRSLSEAGLENFSYPRPCQQRGATWEGCIIITISGHW